MSTQGSFSVINTKKKKKPPVVPAVCPVNVPCVPFLQAPARPTHAMRFLPRAAVRLVCDKRMLQAAATERNVTGQAGLYRSFRPRNWKCFGAGWEVEMREALVGWFVVACWFINYEFIIYY